MNAVAPVALVPVRKHRAGVRPSAQLNAMSVDVEDYFQVQAFAARIPRSSWERFPCRVERNIDRLLDLFAEAEIRATFFILGWIAERYPVVVRRIAAAGHEVASHGYDHSRADALSPAMFRDDIRRAKRIIEDIAARSVHGYRAPTFSIGPRNRWAYQILEEEGYGYSSSIYPIRHDLYGDTSAPRFPFRATVGGFWEIPLTTHRLGGQNLPCAGGGYFRLLPYWFSRWSLARVNAVDHQPCVFYFHPWEIDDQQPRLDAIGMRTRIRHYARLRTMHAKLERLAHDFRWGPIDRVFRDRLTGRAEPVQARLASV
jgi:polysaccharide deacetylase family protein (PEP-CTERM system associated)